MSDSEGKGEIVTSDLMWRFTSDREGVDNFEPVGNQEGKCIVSTLSCINPVLSSHYPSFCAWM